MRLLAALAAGALFGLGAPLACAAADVTVRLSPDASVRGEDITLGELAAIDGDPALASRLRQVRLGPAPLPGTSHRIDAAFLRLRLSEPALEPDRVELQFPDHVIVTREFQVLTAASLVDAVTRQVLERGAALGGQGDPYALVPLTRPADMRVPAGAVELIAHVQGEPSLANALGATVTIKVDGRPFQTIPLSFRVSRYQRVVVAVRPVEAKAVLGPADWRVERRPAIDVPATAMAEMPDASDFEAVQSIKAGDVLTPALLRQRIVVKRGEVVTLILEGPGFRISTKGVAVTDGRRGDTLRVVNQTSKRETIGNVEGSGVVRVPFKDGGGER